MKRLTLVFCFAMAQIAVFGQTVQWGSKVIEFSTELTPVQYSAQQVLGKPNAMPAGGQNPSAWTPDKPKRKEFIKIGYSTPIQIQQIAIAESYNPSALYKVYIYDEAGTEHLVQTLNPMVVPLKGMMRNVFMEKTSFKVAAVKLEFDGAALPDYFSIDAVAISDSSYPIIADIDLPEMLAKGLIVERLDENVNTDASELNPLLSPDGKTLYFSRRNYAKNIGGSNDKEDIWYSELGADGKWSLAKNMGPKFNNDYPNFVNSINAATPDGKSVVLLLGNKYMAKGKMQAGVSMSTNVNGVWSTPTPINIENDYNFNEKANYFMANTRKALLISEERENSLGGRDLYVSFPKPGSDSVWTEPLNLGAILNTAGEETAPFLASDDKTLYFSSNGFSGYGMSDIYMTKRLDDTWTNWTTPENMGPEINSKLDDLFFNIPSTSEYAYYSKGVTENNTDIVRVKVPVLLSPEPIVIVRGKLLDSETNQPVGAKIIYERLPDGKEIGVTQSNPATGEYEIHLPGGHQYGVRAQAEGHLSESQNLDLRNFTKDGTLLADQNIRLAPIHVAKVEPDVVVTLNNIFFDFNKAVLNPASFPELNRIVELMNSKSTMTVEITGHTDATGPADYNLQLSEWRAKSVAKYLTDKNIDKSRIAISFFGETKPKDTNDTVEGRSKNRRVEFKIVKM